MRDGINAVGAVSLGFHAALIYSADFTDPTFCIQAVGSVSGCRDSAFIERLSLALIAERVDAKGVLAVGFHTAFVGRQRFGIGAVGMQAVAFLAVRFYLTVDVVVDARIAVFAKRADAVGLRSLFRHEDAVSQLAARKNVSPIDGDGFIALTLGIKTIGFVTGGSD